MHRLSSVLLPRPQPRRDRVPRRGQPLDQRGVPTVGEPGATGVAVVHEDGRLAGVAMQRGRVARNVATLVDAPTARREEVQPLTAAEARKLLEVATELPNGARWSVALALRLGSYELLRADALPGGDPILILDDVFAELDGQP